MLFVGHESTKRFLVHEATSQGQVFEVPPHATVNISDQMLPPGTLVSGFMQLRVVSGDGVRVAVVVQDAADIPVGPISDTLLQSAVKHARGVYTVPDFVYDRRTRSARPGHLVTIGKLPLPNMVQGEVLGRRLRREAIRDRHAAQLVGECGARSACGSIRAAVARPARS